MGGAGRTKNEGVSKRSNRDLLRSFRERNDPTPTYGTSKRALLLCCIRSIFDLTLGLTISLLNRTDNSMSGHSGNNEQQAFNRQATILRKNLLKADAILRRGSDWPDMLGRLNAAYNQTSNLDVAIQDVWEHFVYLPKQATANPGDIPFFLSTRLESPEEDSANNKLEVEDPVQQLAQYEKNAAKLVKEYEENMVRF